MPANRFLVRGIAGVTKGEVNAPGFKEGSHSLVAGFAIHIGEIVLLVGELTERALGHFCVLAQEIIEHLLPGSAVGGGGVGDHAIQIKDDGVKMTGIIMLGLKRAFGHGFS